jgi:hypothetical protein
MTLNHARSEGYKDTPATSAVSGIRTRNSYLARICVLPITTMAASHAKRDGREGLEEKYSEVLYKTNNC